MSLLLHRARSFAEIAHISQPYGHHKYSYHLSRTVDFLRSALEHDLSGHEHLLAAGYLHDVLEDTAVTKARLKQEFGHEVSDLVDLVTDPPGADRAERKAKLYVRIASSPLRDYATAIKLADRCANLEESLKDLSLGKYTRKFSMYEEEQAGFEMALRTPSKFTKGLWKHLDWLFRMKPDSL